MIDKVVYEIDYIRELHDKYNSDPGLIERALYAFGLLEALKKVGMPFCFKGGTSLMLILDKPLRLSTDIDILVEPGTDVDGGAGWGQAQIAPCRFGTGLDCAMLCVKKTISKSDIYKNVTLW